MDFRGQVKTLLTRGGWELRRATSGPVERRVSLLESKGIDLVVDIGANVGQYAMALRAAGYRGRIVSFEPLPEAFAMLTRVASKDPLWEAHNLALGPADGVVEFNVSRDGVCSSALEPTDKLTGPIPQGGVVDTITVPQARLDDAILDAGPLLLKLDTQGYEHHVLDGAERTLGRAVLLDVEMALVELYAGGSSIYDLLPRFHSIGFSALSIDPGFVDPATSQTLDVDVLMIRAALA